jgi:hypothetical protein
MRIQNPIIILGSGRSGTTIISEMLFRHKDLAFPSNFNEKFPRNPCIGLVRHIYDNGFYRIFGKKKQVISKTPFLNRILFTPSEAWSMWEYVTGLGQKFSRTYLLNENASENDVLRMHEYFSDLIKAQGRNRFACKLTGPTRIEYLMSVFKNPIFIYVERNPVPVISSFIKAPFWQSQGMKQLWWEGAFSDSELSLVEKNRNNGIWMTAFQIKKILENSEFEIEKCKPKMIRIKYEDFVIATSNILSEIISFCDLNPDKACYNYLKRNHIISRSFHDSYYFASKELDIIYSVFDR